MKRTGSGFVLLLVNSCQGLVIKPMVITKKWKKIGPLARNWQFWQLWLTWNRLYPPGTSKRQKWKILSLKCTGGHGLLHLLSVKPSQAFEHDPDFVMFLLFSVSSRNLVNALCLCPKGLTDYERKALPGELLSLPNISSRITGCNYEPNILSTLVTNWFSLKRWRGYSVRFVTALFLLTIFSIHWFLF